MAIQQPLTASRMEILPGFGTDALKEDELTYCMVSIGGVKAN